MFSKGKHLENTLKQILKLPYFVYDYDVINDSWFLILNMTGYATTYRLLFKDFTCLKSKNYSRQKDQVTWVY